MEETIARLQQLIEISPEKLAAFEKERKQTRRFNSVPLLTQLTDDEVAKFSVNQHKFPGVRSPLTSNAITPMAKC